MGEHSNRSIKITQKDIQEGYGFFSLSSGQIIRTLNKKCWNKSNFDKSTGKRYPAGCECKL